MNFFSVTVPFLATYHANSCRTISVFEIYEGKCLSVRHKGISDSDGLPGLDAGGVGV